MAKKPYPMPTPPSGGTKLGTTKPADTKPAKGGKSGGKC